VEKNIDKLLARGIRSSEADSLSAAIEQADQDTDMSHATAIRDELEAIRQRQDKLRQQQADLEAMLKDSKQWLGLNDHHFRDALSVSLELLGSQALTPLSSVDAVDNEERSSWVLPALDQEAGADPTWALTLDSLRQPRTKKQKLWDWRKEAPIRPVVFTDPGSLDGEVVHLHLEHRIVQRLLGRFLSQGFLHHELSRACVCRTEDPIPRVLILGRLSLYGGGAARLHDEIITVAAEWVDPQARGRGRLRPVTEGEKKDVLQILEDSLASPRLREVSPALVDKLKAIAPQDVDDLVPHLERCAQELTERAKRKLTQRGIAEATEMADLLNEQRDRILKEQTQTETSQLELFNADELRQLEADRRHWGIRLTQLEQEIQSEPQRIRQIYEVKAQRVEPVGLIYLWPVSS